MRINTKIKSPNYAIRKYSLQFVIIHYTEMRFEDALTKLCDDRSNVSSHYLICENGDIFNLVDDRCAAWHAGVSHWNGINAINDYSIGIELDNLGVSEFPKQQIKSCIELCKQLVKMHNIPRANILGHSDIAPNRKIDPGIYFSWENLAVHNLGMWHNIDATEINFKMLHKFDDTGPQILKLQQNLRNLGFQIELTSIFDIQTNFVIRSFQSHFYSELIKTFGIDFYRNIFSKYSWDSVSESILQNLLLKYAHSHSK